MQSKVLWRILSVAALGVAVTRCGIAGSGGGNNNNTTTHHPGGNNSAQDAGDAASANGVSTHSVRSTVTDRLTSGTPRPVAMVRVPTGYVACNDPASCTATPGSGGAADCSDRLYGCPADGQCSTDGTCLVAPTQCDACANGSGGPLCCNNLCCPAGSTCDGTFCRIEAAVKPQTCSATVDVQCGALCCPKSTACDGDRCTVHGSVAITCNATQVSCDDGRCCGQDEVCCGASCCPSGSICTAQGTCVQAASPPDPKTNATCPANFQPHMYTQVTPADSVGCCPTGLTTPANACLCLASTAPAAPCGNGQVEISGYCCPDLSAVNASYNLSYSVYDYDGDLNVDCVWNNCSAPTCTDGQATASGVCCPDGTGTTGPATADQVCCGNGVTCGDSCCADFLSCTADDPAIGGGPSCQQSSTPVQQPQCPSGAPTQCGSVCCPTSTTCSGTQFNYCGCPLNAPYWCGDHCAANATACGSPCPPDYPTACGDVCCAGDCVTDGQCACGAGTQPCLQDETASSSGASSLAGGSLAADYCCDTGSSCTTVGGQLMCASCPSGTPVVCGNNCCATGDLCVNGQCVDCQGGGTPCGNGCCPSDKECIAGNCECPGSAPISCGNTCCNTDEICQSGTCVTQRPPSGSGGSGSGGSGSGGRGGGGGSDICPETNGCTCATGECCNGNNGNPNPDCPGPLNPCACPTDTNPTGPVCGNGICETGEEGTCSDCPPNTTCEFRCGDGTCIAAAIVCNGTQDCPGGEDEDPSVCSDQGSCCEATQGCPGETGNDCAATCCCCPQGEACCADHTKGCCPAP